MNCAIIKFPEVNHYYHSDSMLCSHAPVEIQRILEDFGVGIDCIVKTDKVGRIYDVLLDWNTVGFLTVLAISDAYKVATVPTVYEGPYSLAKVREFSVDMDIVIIPMTPGEVDYVS